MEDQDLTEQSHGDWSGDKNGMGGSPTRVYTVDFAGTVGKDVLRLLS